MRVLLTAAAAAAALLASAGAASAVTTLTFDGNICGAAGTGVCANGTQIGQSYGDTSQIDISHRSYNATTGVTLRSYLQHWFNNYGDLTRVAYGGDNATNFRAEITFTPAAGHEVRLLGFDAGCYLNRSSCQTLNYTVRSVGGVAIAGGSTPTLNPGHASVDVTSGWFTDGIVLTWGPDSYDVGLDNISFDVRAVGSVPVVPEPTTWALMIAGFGGVGFALRRRVYAHA